MIDQRLAVNFVPRPHRDMRKVAIIGSSGSGKSTLTTKLQKQLRIPLYHLDSLFWKPNWNRTSEQDWVGLQKRLVQEPEWIIDGNYGGTLDIRLDAADTILFLKYSRIQCLWGGLKRHILRNRVDRIRGCREKFDLEFYKGKTYAGSHLFSDVRHTHII